MSKPVLITLPFVLILFDYWPLRRFDLNVKGFLKSAYEKIPLFALTTILIIVTFSSQKMGGAMYLNSIPLYYKLSNALASYLDYISNIFIPLNLAALYPHPVENISLIKVSIALIILTAITSLVLINAKKHRFLFTGWLWFLGVLVPNLGLVQLGWQARADRYMYIPLVGFSIVIIWGLSIILDRFVSKKSEIQISVGLAVLTISTLSILTYKQIGYWENEISIFERATSVTRNNYIAHNNLGRALFLREHIESSVDEFKKSIAISPNHPAAISNVGAALMKKRGV